MYLKFIIVVVLVILAIISFFSGWMYYRTIFLRTKILDKQIDNAKKANKMLQHQLSVTSKDEC